MTRKNTNSSPLKSGDIPATKAHLELFRQELKSDITSLSLQMDSQFKDLDSKFASIEGRFTTIDSKFTNLDSKFKNIDSKFINLDSKFKSIDSKFEKLTSVLFEMKAILEEQNSRNRVVLDGYAHLFDKSTATDSRIENLEKKIFGVSQK